MTTHRRIAAIETKFKGYRFRSRLEARWAVFFHTLGLDWQYEPEGFVLPSGAHYLPDFRVTSKHGVVVWYEVKPDGVNSDDKFSEFSKTAFKDQELTGFRLLSGDPYSFVKPEAVCPRCGTIGGMMYLDRDGDGEFIAGCWPCDVGTPSGGGHDYEEGATMMVYPHKGSVCGEYWSVHACAVNNARKASRAARFEHGERGAE